MGPTGLTFYTICYIANSLFGVLPRAHYQLQIRPNLAFINWFVKLNGNSVLIPGIYLGEIKGKNLARLAHLLSTFIRTHLLRRISNHSNTCVMTLNKNSITITNTLHNFVSPTAIDLLKIPHWQLWGYTLNKLYGCVWCHRVWFLISEIGY